MGVRGDRQSLLTSPPRLGVLLCLCLLFRLKLHIPTHETVRNMRNIVFSELRVDYTFWDDIIGINMSQVFDEDHTFPYRVICRAGTCSMAEGSSRIRVGMGKNDWKWRPISVSWDSGLKHGCTLRQL